MQLGVAAMSSFSRVAVLVFVLNGIAGAAPDMAKILGLMEDLKKDIVADGVAEATTYAKVASQCKEINSAKSDSIVEEKGKIDVLSADIGDASESKNTKETELAKRQADGEEMAATLTAVKQRCEKDEATYKNASADGDHAIGSLNKAIATMKEKMGEVSFLEVSSELPKGVLRLVQSLVDPVDPSYQYHGKEVQQLLEKLLSDFTAEKTARSDDWNKTSAACSAEQTALTGKIKDNTDAMNLNREEIQGFQKEVSENKGSLIMSNDALVADEGALKVNTASCEAAATEHDARTKLQTTTVQALSEVMARLGNKETSLVSEAAGLSAATLALKQGSVEVKKSPARALSFLQAAPIKAVTRFLAMGEVKMSAIEKAKLNKVLDVLRLEASKLQSPLLSAMSMRIAEDQFTNVKKLINDLITELQNEDKSAASKHHFCVLEIGKAKKDQEYAERKAESSTSSLALLESKKEELATELKELQAGIEDTQTKLTEATDLRKEMKSENLANIKTVEDGIKTLDDALKSYAKVSNTLAKAGTGNAKSGSTAIVAILQLASDDFTIMLKETKHEEAAAHDEFVKFERASKVDLSSKNTAKLMHEQDQKSTESDIAKTTTDLTTQQGLVDGAVKIIENLEKVCNENYAAREAKRDEEVAALEQALKALSE
jgi:DNA repair exonuclease SbcCD ATPase subunit